jgi:hypothetical protein
MSTKETLPTMTDVEVIAKLRSFSHIDVPSEQAITLITSLRTRLDAAEKDRDKWADLARAQAQQITEHITGTSKDGLHKELAQLKERLSEVSKGSHRQRNAMSEGCPCLHTEPCDPRCTCVHGSSSFGCSRCCTYGSKEQQKKRAEYLATLQARTKRLEKASRNLLLSADASWMNGKQGHDWPEAVKEAKAVLEEGKK